MVESDPKDWQIWQEIHDAWARLVSAELDRRAGRPAQWYLQLLDEIRDPDDLLTNYSLATRGSSTSTLSQVEAFVRGYR